MLSEYIQTLFINGWDKICIRAAYQKEMDSVRKTQLMNAVKKNM